MLSAPQISEQPATLAPFDAFLQASVQGSKSLSELGSEPVRVKLEELLTFASALFSRVGLSRAAANEAAEVLVTSDLRGIESHGVPRLDMYINLIRGGLVQPEAPLSVLRESASTAALDANNGLGLLVGRKAMRLAIEKAQKSGIGLVSVTNSSHFGIAGFYAEMALPHDMLGLALTNSTPVSVPTHAKQPRLGSNPLAFAAPTRHEWPFLLDMATTSVALGKFEIAARQEQSVPLGWGVDEKGLPTEDPTVVLRQRSVTPLGSTPLLSSHKGYGLQMMIDILAGVLSGMGYSQKVPDLKAGHFFGAIRIDAFRDVDEFKTEMDEMIQTLHATPRVDENQPIYIPGEQSYRAEQENRRLGVPLHPKVFYRLQRLAEEYAIEFKL